jgi:hypothetical protein
MEKKSAGKWNSRENGQQKGPMPSTGTGDSDCARHIGDLEEQLKRLSDGEAEFWAAPDCPQETRETDLEDILAFESVENGVSLFEGLQKHGLNLPPPEGVSEESSADKVAEILYHLARLRIFLVGYHEMTAREFYTTLWYQTLWEGCYIEKRNPAAITIIDVSHGLSRPEWKEMLEELKKSTRVQ